MKSTINLAPTNKAEIEIANSAAGAWDAIQCSTWTRGNDQGFDAKARSLRIEEPAFIESTQIR